MPLWQVAGKPDNEAVCHQRVAEPGALDKLDEGDVKLVIHSN